MTLFGVTSQTTVFFVVLQDIGTRGEGLLHLGIKQLRCEVDHSPLSSAKIKNVWSYTFFSPNVFIAWCLIKHGDNITFVIYVRGKFLLGYM
jgi:hypothetical protein